MVSYPEIVNLTKLARRIISIHSNRDTSVIPNAIMIALIPNGFRVRGEFAYSPASHSSPRQHESRHGSEPNEDINKNAPHAAFPRGTGLGKDDIKQVRAPSLSTGFHQSFARAHQSQLGGDTKSSNPTKSLHLSMFEQGGQKSNLTTIFGKDPLNSTQQNNDNTFGTGDAKSEHQNIFRESMGSNTNAPSSPEAAGSGSTPKSLHLSMFQQGGQKPNLTTIFGNDPLNSTKQNNNSNNDIFGTGGAKFDQENIFRESMGNINNTNAPTSAHAMMFGPPKSDDGTKSKEANATAGVILNELDNGQSGRGNALENGMLVEKAATNAGSNTTPNYPQAAGSGNTPKSTTQVYSGHQGSSSGGHVKRRKLAHPVGGPRTSVSGAGKAEDVVANALPVPPSESKVMLWSFDPSGMDLRWLSNFGDFDANSDMQLTGVKFVEIIEDPREIANSIKKRVRFAIHGPHFECSQSGAAAAATRLTGFQKKALYNYHAELAKEICQLSLLKASLCEWEDSVGAFPDAIAELKTIGDRYDGQLRSTDEQRLLRLYDIIAKQDETRDCAHTYDQLLEADSVIEKTGSMMLNAGIVKDKRRDKIIEIITTIRKEIAIARHRLEEAEKAAKKAEEQSKKDAAERDKQSAVAVKQKQDRESQRDADNDSEIKRLGEGLKPNEKKNEIDMEDAGGKNGDVPSAFKNEGSNQAGQGADANASQIQKSSVVSIGNDTAGAGEAAGGTEQTSGGSAEEGDDPREVKLASLKAVIQEEKKKVEDPKDWDTTEAEKLAADLGKPGREKFQGEIHIEFVHRFGNFRRKHTRLYNYQVLATFFGLWRLRVDVGKQESMTEARCSYHYDYARFWGSVYRWYSEYLQPRVDEFGFDAAIVDPFLELLQYFPQQTRYSGTEQILPKWSPNDSIVWLPDSYGNAEKSHYRCLICGYTSHTREKRFTGGVLDSSKPREWSPLLCGLCQAAEAQYLISRLRQHQKCFSEVRISGARDFFVPDADAPLALNSSTKISVHTLRRVTTGRWRGKETWDEVFILKKANSLLLNEAADADCENAGFEDLCIKLSVSTLQNKVTAACGDGEAETKTKGEQSQESKIPHVAAGAATLESSISLSRPSGPNLEQAAQNKEKKNVVPGVDPQGNEVRQDEGLSSVAEKLEDGAGVKSATEEDDDTTRDELPHNSMNHTTDWSSTSRSGSKDGGVVSKSETFSEDAEESHDKSREVRFRGSQRNADRSSADPQGEGVSAGANLSPNRNRGPQPCIPLLTDSPVKLLGGEASVDSAASVNALAAQRSFDKDSLPLVDLSQSGFGAGKKRQRERKIDSQEESQQHRGGGGGGDNPETDDNDLQGVLASGLKRVVSKETLEEYIEEYDADEPIPWEWDLNNQSPQQMVFKEIRALQRIQALLDATRPADDDDLQTIRDLKNGQFFPELHFPQESTPNQKSPKPSPKAVNPSKNKSPKPSKEKKEKPPVALRALFFPDGAVGEPFFISSHCGRTLRSLFTEEKEPNEVTKRLASKCEKSLARGITWLHLVAGIIHNDVSGGNVLFGGGDHFRLADFGSSFLAKHCDRCRHGWLPTMTRPFYFPPWCKHMLAGVKSKYRYTTAEGRRADLHIAKKLVEAMKKKDPLFEEKDREELVKRSAGLEVVELDFNVRCGRKNTNTTALALDANTDPNMRVEQ